MHALEPARTDPGDAPHLQRFEALYRDEFTFVWAVARHLGVHPAAIEDIVQDVFLTAYRRLEHLHFEVSPRAWLFGVTRRVAFRYRRGAARRARQVHAFAELVRPLGETPQHRHDDAQQLDRLLARLSATGRTVWQMTELLGMSAPEIASELGIPLNTVYSRLRLARAQLQTLADAATLEAWRSDARRRQDPPSEAQARSWALLLPVLGDPGAGAGVVAWIKSQAAAATTMIAAGAVVVGLAVRPGPPLLAAPAPVATPSTPARAARVAAASAIDSSSARLAAAAGPPAAPVAAPSPAERRPSARPAALHSAEARARLSEEVALIDRARRQLAADDAPAALATLATHAQSFPAGILADIREAAHVDVLCRRGDITGAEAVAQRLRSDYPESAVAQRFANYHCPQ